MTVADFERNGVRFLYPEGWTLSDEEWEFEPRTITVQSPLGGFWCLHYYQDGEPQRLVEEVVQAMTEEYDSLESRAVDEPMAAGTAIGRDLSFYCLDLLVTAKVRALSTASGTYLMISQAEDRDFDKLVSVFDAISFSLLQPVGEPEG